MNDQVITIWHKICFLSKGHACKNWRKSWNIVVVYVEDNDVRIGDLIGAEASKDHHMITNNNGGSTIEIFWKLSNNWRCLGTANHSWVRKPSPIDFNYFNEVFFSKMF